MGFGIGLGAFMSGLAGGIGTGRALHQMQKERGIEQAGKDAMNSAKAARETDISRGIMPMQMGEGTMYQVGDQVFDNEAGARSAREKMVKPLSEYIYSTAIPKMRDAYIEAGDMDSALRLDQYMQTQESKQGIARFANLMSAVTRKDPGAIAQALVGGKAEGYEVLSAKANKDDKGGFAGISMQYRTPAGEKVSQTFGDMDEIARYGIGLLSPEKQFEYWMSSNAAAQKSNADMSKMEAEHGYRLDEIRTRGAEDRKTVAARGSIDNKTAQPADVRTAEWLVKIGKAKDAGEAWDLVRSARAKSPQDFALEYAKANMANQTRDISIPDTAKRTPGQWYQEGLQIFGAANQAQGSQPAQSSKTYEDTDSFLDDLGISQ